MRLTNLSLQGSVSGQRNRQTRLLHLLRTRRVNCMLFSLCARETARASAQCCGCHSTTQEHLALWSGGAADGLEGGVLVPEVELLGGAELPSASPGAQQRASAWLVQLSPPLGFTVS